MFSMLVALNQKAQFFKEPNKSHVIQHCQSSFSSLLRLLFLFRLIHSYKDIFTMVYVDHAQLYNFISSNLYNTSKNVILPLIYSNCILLRCLFSLGYFFYTSLYKTCLSVKSLCTQSVHFFSLCDYLGESNSHLLVTCDVVFIVLYEIFKWQVVLPKDCSLLFFKNVLFLCFHSLPFRPFGGFIITLFFMFLRQM